VCGYLWSPNLPLMDRKSSQAICRTHSWRVAMSGLRETERGHRESRAERWGETHAAPSGRPLSVFMFGCIRNDAMAKHDACGCERARVEPRSWWIYGSMVDLALQCEASEASVADYSVRGFGLHTGAKSEAVFSRYSPSSESPAALHRRKQLAPSAPDASSLAALSPQKENKLLCRHKSL
jgi:hypothetical protein